MKIKTLLILNVAFSIIILFLVGLVIFWTLQEEDAARNREIIAYSIVKEVNDLRGLAFDFSIHEEERVIVQWRSKIGQVEKLVAEAEFEKPEQKEIIYRISNNLDEMDSAFYELAAIRKASVGAAMYQQQEERLVSLLLLKVQLIVLDAFKLAESSNIVMDLASKSLQIIVVFIMILSTVTISISILILRSIIQPLSRLQEGTERLGSGDLDYRVEIKSYDEINQLSDAFNLMTGKLKERTTHLESAIRELEDFAYSASHDLRSPLRAIDGFSNAFLEDYGRNLDGTEIDYLNRIRAAAQKMSDIIDAMIELSGITRKEMQFEKVNLSEMAKKISGELEKSQPERKVEFLIADGVIVNGDPKMLDIMLTNLLGNAWKFTGKHPSARIEFGITQAEGKTAYFVRDDGAGFDMRYVDKLFKPFERLHIEADFHGIGIGLASVKRIIQRHKGMIWAEGAVEKGATFYFTLQEGK